MLVPLVVGYRGSRGLPGRLCMVLLDGLLVAVLGLLVWTLDAGLVSGTGWPGSAGLGPLGSGCWMLTAAAGLWNPLITWSAL